LVVPGATRQRPFPPLERLQGAIAEMPIRHAGSSINVTASFGVAWLTGNSDTAERLLSRADVALYSAKQAGRNRLENAATGWGSDEVRPLACSSTRLPGKNSQVCSLWRARHSLDELRHSRSGRPLGT
jgi:hypothetical protein